MKVCIVVEGCYPYVVGGVSSWVHSLIKQFSNVEFQILTIVADRSMRGKFVYEMPENVSEIREIYVQDVDWVGHKKRRKKLRLKNKDFDALRSLILGEDIKWDDIFTFFQKGKFSINELLMGKDFLLMGMELYKKHYENVTFSDFLWSLRSMYLPLFLCLKTPLPKADLYHCVATGYAGVIGSMAKSLNANSTLLLSEHGIYSREREEDIIKASWVQGVYKNIWIDFFKKMSTCTYNSANRVTSLFEYARHLQIELGCPERKTLVTPNGIDPARFAGIPGKQPGDENFFNIGAVLRIAPIKDVKTLINAFYYAKQREPSLKLWIMGPWEEEDPYAKEVFTLVNTLQPQDLVFTGRIDVTQYLGRMDATILSSISEGQPLTILEGFAAHCPAIATNVGNCEGLIYGEGEDTLGAAGIVTDTMSVAGLADAMVRMARDPEFSKHMGEIGYQRLMNKYQLSQMKATYNNLYQEMADISGATLSNTPFKREAN